MLCLDLDCLLCFLYLQSVLETGFGLAIIKEELTQFLDKYYNGPFVQLVCDYIRSMGMTRQEVERMSEEMRKVKGA